MNADAIISIVERGKADNIVKKAKEAGSKGATIFYGRGTGSEEAKNFLNIHIDSQKEVIIIITAKEDTKRIYDTIVNVGCITCPGKGIIFVLPVEKFAGFFQI